MNRVKKIVMVSVLIVLAIAAFLKVNDLYYLTGPKLDKPVFVKQLTYNSEMDATLNYISSKSWDKGVKDIQVLGVPDWISCTVYGETVEQALKYKVSTVEIGINSKRLNEKAQMPENIKITKLKVTWDDGSQTKEDIGEITIVNDLSEYYPDGGYGSSFSEDQDKSSTDFKDIPKTVKIIGLYIPKEDIIKKKIKDITINEVPLEEINEKKPLTVKKGESITVELTTEKGMVNNYGTVSVAGELLIKGKGGSEHFGQFTSFAYRFNSLGIKPYIEQVIK